MSIIFLAYRCSGRTVLLLLLFRVLQVRLDPDVRVQEPGGGARTGRLLSDSADLPLKGENTL